MKQIPALLSALFSASAIASGPIDTPAFKLPLEGNWIEERSPVPQQYSYYSEELDIAITASYDQLNTDPSKTEAIANTLAQLRLEGEQAAAEEFDVEMKIVEPYIGEFPRGHQVAYYGHDSSGREFRYLGIVTPEKVINIYAESKSKSQSQLEGFFNELIQGLSF